MASNGWWPAERLELLFLGLWVAGMLGFAGWQVLRIIHFRRLPSRGQPPPNWLASHVKRVAAALGVRPPRTLVVPDNGSPVLWCLGAPRLLIPASLLGQLEAAWWPGVFVHELAHLRRRDHWVSWLELVAGCFWWWNPVFWLVRRQLRQHAEMACDAWVIEILPDGRRAYAETLLAVSQAVSRAAVPAPALAIAPRARRAFERRLTMIMSGRVTCRVPVAVLAFVALLAAAALPGWSVRLAADEPEKKRDAKPSPTAPKALPPDEALKKARCDGKYVMLLRQIKVASDAERYGSFRDEGFRQRTEYAGHQDLPAGHWVYVAPYWYIWRDRSGRPQPKRPWGPEQVTGPPDTWPQAGDIGTAWASLTEDGQDEWLLLEYAEPIMPNAVLIYETFNPGAVRRVTVFNLNGEEVEVWKGKDPTPIGKPNGLSVIPFRIKFKTNRIKIYIASKEVTGWNEIDAVGLRDVLGRTHWAAAAEASSTYAQVAMPIDDTDRRLDRLEAEIRELKASIQELKELIKKRKRK
jgi:beta-lactamase regulating signal transducer with metallopeptidase domain